MDAQRRSYSFQLYFSIFFHARFRLAGCMPDWILNAETTNITHTSESTCHPRKDANTMKPFERLIRARYIQFWNSFL
jgi:hypothetical protein